MELKDNYQLQAQQAQQYFLRYDQDALIKKLGLQWDAQYFYVNLIGNTYRICRKNGTQQKREGTAWVDANSHREVMTLLDLVCDSRPDRFVTGRLQSMESFGRLFHQNLLQERKNPVAERIQRDPAGFCRACEALGGKPVPGGDLAYSIPLFEDLQIGLMFWEGDEEFYPRLRYLWDENALMYLKYETMYFALDLMLAELSDRWM